MGSSGLGRPSPVPSSLRAPDRPRRGAAECGRGRERLFNRAGAPSTPSARAAGSQRERPGLAGDRRTLARAPAAAGRSHPRTGARGMSPAQGAGRGPGEGGRDSRSGAEEEGLGLQTP